MTKEELEEYTAAVADLVKESLPEGLSYFLTVFETGGDSAMVACASNYDRRVIAGLLERTAALLRQADVAAQIDAQNPRPGGAGH